MARGAAKLQWDQTALIWALHANINRDAKDKPEPFLPSDIHPFRTADEYRDDKKRERQISAIKRSCKVKRLKSGRFGNISGQGIPPTPG